MKNYQPIGLTKTKIRLLSKYLRKKCALNLNGKLQRGRRKSTSKIETNIFWNQTLFYFFNNIPRSMIIFIKKEDLNELHLNIFPKFYRTGIRRKKIFNHTFITNRTCWDKFTVTDPHTWKFFIMCVKHATCI